MNDKLCCWVLASVSSSPLGQLVLVCCVLDLTPNPTARGVPWDGPLGRRETVWSIVAVCPCALGSPPRVLESRRAQNCCLARPPAPLLSVPSYTFSSRNHAAASHRHVQERPGGLTVSWLCPASNVVGAWVSPPQAALKASGPGHVAVQDSTARATVTRWPCVLTLYSCPGLH